MDKVWEEIVQARAEIVKRYLPKPAKGFEEEFGNDEMAQQADAARVRKELESLSTELC